MPRDGRDEGASRSRRAERAEGAHAHGRAACVRRAQRTCVAGPLWAKRGAAYAYASEWEADSGCVYAQLRVSVELRMPMRASWQADSGRVYVQLRMRLPVHG